MSSNFSFHTTLYRSSIVTPWGFKVEGGKEYGSPLIIQRVFQGSPASVDLQRGDIILRVQQRDVKQMHHYEAVELIENAGGSLQLTVNRASAGASFSTHYANSTPSYNVASPYSNYPFHRYNLSLNRNLPHTNLVSALSDYQQSESYPLFRSRPFDKQYYPKPVLSQTGSPILPSVPLKPKNYVRKASLQLSKPISILESVQPILPYREKEFNDQLHNSLKRAVNRPRYYGNSYAVYDMYSDDNQAALKPLPVSNHPRPVEPKVIYSKYGASDLDTSQPQQLQVVNKQYNTPIGLYSASSLNQELQKQVGPLVENHMMDSSEF